MELSEKEDRAISILKELKSVAVAFSGGVDSALVCSLARQALGERAIAIYGISPLEPDELDHISNTAEMIGIELRTVNVSHLADEQLVSNSPERCYYCKSALFKAMADIANQANIGHLVDGSIEDDLSDSRPGMRAAIEFKVRSPLIEAGITKSEVRELSRKRSLPTWDKPQNACLASRIPYGTKITEELLQRIGEAERFLKSLGFGQLRVRIHDLTARIELEPDEFGKALEKRQEIVAELKHLGFVYITLDLIGFRSGSMNEVP